MPNSNGMPKPSSKISNPRISQFCQALASFYTLMPKRKPLFGISVIVEGIRERRLRHSNLIEIYQRFHGWLQETRRLKPILHLPLVRPSEGALSRAFADSKNKMGIKARFRKMTAD